MKEMQITVEQAKAGIEPAVLARLLRGIESLLKAGRNTEQVVEALKVQSSFGKYVGCHPAAIRALAIATCKDITAQQSALYREAVQRMQQNENFQTVKQHYRAEMKKLFGI